MLWHVLLRADSREGQQVLDEPLHARGTGHSEVDELRGLAAKLIPIAVSQQLDVARDRAQRLLQIMRSHIGETFELFVRAPQLLLGLFARADVDDRCKHEQPFLRLDRVQGDLDGNLRAVATQPEQISTRTHAAGQRRAVKRRPQLRMTIAHVPWYEYLDRLP